ncbi:LysR family transcriptional regulator [Nissabacter sp. SGAir0207]|uniref:LysR family transcriptional regulator n=1 Tax=Nissabacter sp. SGAir0207 TaxID=2126321 RepID=UPI0010CD561B|nr:LysR family transcriptional regulator [Nissabacter sp. SGAir0207]QCR38682.1 LysR family transcriptional regulator [Nissabacter sp. SGAir0207]
MIDRFTSMSVFVKVCELGTFSAAGTVLGLSSQMVGKHVKALEARLGAQLIRRSTRRQSLTEVGQMFYDQCLIVLADLKDAETVTEKMNAAPQGHLRISAPVGFGSCLLAPALMQFMEIYNKIEIELVITDRFVDLLHEGFDAVLRLGPFADSSLAVRYISQHRQVLCASPDYLARFGTPEKPGDLKDHDCLSYLNASGLPYTQWLFSKDGQEEAIRVQSRFRVNDGRVLAEAAVAGRGIILQPEAVLRKYLDSGELVSLLEEYTAPIRDMALIFSAAHPQTPKMRALIDFIVARFPITLQA